MKKINILKNAKYFIILIFAIFSILSLLLIGTVKINYNISDYLDDSTDTKISLGIMEEEFGLISNIQVMIDGVTPNEAEEIKTQLKAIENVNFVNFNSQNTDYYKDETALFVVLVDGNEYSESAKAALSDIESALGEKYGNRLNLGGTVMEKRLLREAIQGEIILILGISICLVAVLMLVTAASWIEPLVLLAASGVAVLLNMGTNAIFGEISYITNAIAAILQLALSIDYSIVLLHSYRTIKENNPTDESEHSMLRAIKEVAKPVSASALTTIAGLLALLFMSFTIGFDIGSVLMKSIVVSAITSLTLLPAFLLVFDKLMHKTAKKPLVIKGRLFCNISTKYGKLIAPAAFVVIIVCCVLNLGNSYSFVDSCNKNENITDKFGESGTLIVLYENAENNEDKEKLLSELLASYETEDGKKVLKSHVAYSNTIGQIYDVEKASKDLGLSMKDAELLFTIYRFTENGSAVKINTREFCKFAIALIEGDEDAEGFVSEETKSVLEMIITLDRLMANKNSAEAFHTAVSSLTVMEGKELSRFAIDQMYGLYHYDYYGDQNPVDFKEMLEFTIGSGMLNEDISSQLLTLLEGVGGLHHPEEDVFLKDLPGLIGISSTEATYLWTRELKLPVGGSIHYLELMEHLADGGYVGDASLVRIINNYEYIYNKVNQSYKYDEFIPALREITYQLTGSAPSISVEATAVQQLYIMYFYDEGIMPSSLVINGRDFIEFIIESSKSNETVSSQMPEGVLPMLTDVLSIDDFLNDDTAYDHAGMKSKISKFAESITSMDVTVSLSDGAMMGVYVKYAVQNNLIETGSISATDLLTFVLNEAQSNELLASSIDGEMQKTIRESQENMISASKLLTAENYSRMLLTVNLPAESGESSRFVEYLTEVVKETFGDDAYVAGEIATTNDLIKAFDDDNRLISIFTVVSIFIIIMLVFRSVSLPVLLVAVIQGAIWIAMSMSLVSGPMFFMSYIMSMCILMGATIDYGILLSTNYVKWRATLDKKEALYQAVDAAIPTVFTSGLILMICGLVVGFVATQTSISSVGFLLFRGTLISTVMIMLVLPSLLYLLDGFVIRLTLKDKTTN